MRSGTRGTMVWAADLLCLLTAAIWGTGFIASQVAIDAQMSAALIMTLRFAIAALVMLAVCLPKLRRLCPRDLRLGGLAGVFLFGAFYAQIIGQQNTTVSHCAFLTATNVVMVPFIVWAVSRRRPASRTFALTATTLIGIGVLSIAPGDVPFGLHFGDAMTLLCALLFALHITTLGWATRDADVMLINLIQLATAAVISAAVLFLADRDALAAANLRPGLPAVIYLGLFSTCLCYFLQTLAQKYTTPAQAGVLLSTEGLFGSVFSVLLGLEAPAANLVVGGLIIMASILLMELFPSKSQQIAAAWRRPDENSGG